MSELLMLFTGNKAENVHGFERTVKWYELKPERVCDSERFKLLWDFTIQTDHQIEYNKPHIVLVNKVDKSCTIIDVACPFDRRLVSNGRQKIKKYQDQKNEIKRIWNVG